VTLTLFAGADAGAVADKLRSLGLTLGGVTPGHVGEPGRSDRPGRVVVLFRPGELVDHRETIAHWSETVWIGRRPVYGLLNDASAWVGQSGLDGGLATPVYANGIFGAGQVIGVLDTGLDADMCFFRDDANGLPPTNSDFGPGSPDPAQRKVLIVNFLWGADNPGDSGDWDSQDHGTHVAGTIAGDNLATPGLRDAADGMAPAAKLVIQDGGFGTDDCADMPAIGCPAADLYPFFEQAWSQGARIHSNSYGDRENFTPYDLYSDGSEAADAFMWDHPEFLLVFAAGNNGPGSSTVSSPATAKNVLAVGATRHGTDAGSLAGWSSQGPTHDGRIKPDVTAPGESVVSANNDLNVNTQNCGTRTMSGTSMACPTAAGLAALVREYYDKGYHPSGAADPDDAFAPSAALVKATLIASATPMEGIAAPVPSNPQGWGRVKLDDALYFAGDAKRIFAVDLADRFGAPGGPGDEYLLPVLDGSEPLRVVLAWTDYPSTPAAAINLVNDLNLEVESPSGEIYLGNVFSGGVSQTGGSADALNNVEAVRIEAPETGTWSVRVLAQAVPQPDQGYALIATGRLPTAGVDLARTALSIDDTVHGDGDGILDPGEWVELPLSLINGGNTTATNVRVEMTSPAPEVQVAADRTLLPDLETAEVGSTDAPQLKLRLATDTVCGTHVSVGLTYLADGFSTTEMIELPVGSEQVFLTDDLEGPTGWAHVPEESTAATGDWTLGDPIGTSYQPEDDATPAPGTTCLYTAPNPDGEDPYDDVDEGLVVARSGAYDLSGHPGARLRISRWLHARDLSSDPGDWFRLEVREEAGAGDVLLEQFDPVDRATRWRVADYRLADFITPGPDVEPKVSASDAAGSGNILEAAIDEIVFWEPGCSSYSPPPDVVDDLTIARLGNDLLLSWDRPAPDAWHGEATSYPIYRAAGAPAGFGLLDELFDGSPDLEYTDPDAVDDPPLLFYSVITRNAAGDSEPLP
jgi:hypothetical protein